jgi:hypothetical protein
MLKVTDQAAMKLKQTIPEKDLTGKSLRVLLNGFG